MAIVSGGPQQSLVGKMERTRAATTKEAATRRVKGALGAKAPPPSQRIGVVCVHGIGSQRPGEILLDWSRPIIKVLTDWVVDHKTNDAMPRLDADSPRDPVATSHVDFAGGELPIVEISIPPAVDGDGTTWPAQTWVMTEAWWAARVQPPSLGTMTKWIRTDFGRVVVGIEHGIGEETDPVAAAGLEFPAWVRALDRFTVKRIRPLLTLLWSLAYVLLMLPYAFLRSLPVGPLKDFAGLKLLDSFLVDWFGDMRILLYDPAQAANIRGRVAEAIRALQELYGCERIVVVAHSGGALVSFTTLTDGAYLTHPRFKGLKVDKLITLGQALALAWRLSARTGARFEDERLSADIHTAQRGLTWVDFWSTYDPAPGGHLVRNADEDEQDRLTPLADSRPVRNRMSILDDHGGYWDNDEEFLIPLIREIDTAGGDGESRFFRNESVRRERAVRRVERVATLAVWRWAVALGGLAAFAVAVVRTAFTSTDRLGEIGGWSIGFLSSLPGHEFLSAPIEAVAHLIGLVPSIPDRVIAIAAAALLGLVLGVAAWLVPRLIIGERYHRAVAARTPEPVRARVPRPMLLAGLVIGLLTWFVVPTELAQAMQTLISPIGGRWAAGLITVVALFVVIARIGRGRWEQWDADERWRLHHDPPKALERGRWQVEGAILVAIALNVAIILALG